jgi:ketosteroid isomerase-like protein
MKRFGVLAALFVVVPALAFGHVTVAPRELQQRFADGKVSNWTPGTKLTDTPATAPTGPQAQPTGEAAAIERWLGEYDAAFNAKDLEKLATFYHADVTIYEGGGINNGWIDYRDRHLGPELKAFQNLQFGHSNTKVTLLPGGRSAYATSEYSIKAKMGDRDLDSRGLETLVLIKGEDGSWKIRHSHTSSRPRRPAQ